VDSEKPPLQPSGPPVSGRRGFLRNVLAAGGTTGVVTALADTWSRPVVHAVVLPAHGQASDRSATDGRSETDPTFEILFEGATATDGVTLIITGGTGCYEFGMRETADVSPWEELYHPASSTGVALDQVGSPGNVVLGSTTLFSSATAGTLTFIVRVCNGTECWVWGDDPGTFDNQGCTVL
jgi:hypothetical protein